MHVLLEQALHWVTKNLSTWAMEADPIGLSSNVSNTWPMLWPNSFSRTSRTASNGVAGAWSHKVTSFLTHAAGARSGFPRICAAYWRQWKRNKFSSSETVNNLRVNVHSLSAKNQRSANHNKPNVELWLLEAFNKSLHIKGKTLTVKEEARKSKIE